MNEGHIRDVSATVLERLGVPIPEDLDGRPLPLGVRVPA
jgi:bisphosphoglycerate-independent phosphoglycerate mutase (AlkP superfamily)